VNTTVIACHNSLLRLDNHVRSIPDSCASAILCPPTTSRTYHHCTLHPHRPTHTGRSTPKFFNVTPSSPIPFIACLLSHRRLSPSFYIHWQMRSPTIRNTKSLCITHLPPPPSAAPSSLCCPAHLTTTLAMLMTRSPPLMSITWDDPWLARPDLTCGSSATSIDF
jgi:hypothetical protein